MPRMPPSPSSPSPQPKFSFSERLDAQLNPPEPAGRLHPVVSVALVRKRKPPAARTANSLLATASIESVVLASANTLAPVWPLGLAREPKASAEAASGVGGGPVGPGGAPAAP